MTEEKYYYMVNLELWYRTSERLFGLFNISHIPYKKLEEIFKEQLTREEFLFDDVAGYQIDEDLYKTHKEFLDKEILVDFDFSLFEYWVGMTGVKMNKYKKNYYETLPEQIGRK